MEDDSQWQSLKREAKKEEKKKETLQYWISQVVNGFILVKFI